MKTPDGEIIFFQNFSTYPLYHWKGAESEAVFKETLAKEGAHHVKVETIAVFADNYAEPSFFTEEDVLPHLASTQTLKKEVQRIVKEEKTPVSEGLKSACLKHYVPADE